MTYLDKFTTHVSLHVHSLPWSTLIHHVIITSIKCAPTPATPNYHYPPPYVLSISCAYMLSPPLVWRAAGRSSAHRSAQLWIMHALSIYHTCMHACMHVSSLAINSIMSDCHLKSSICGDDHACRHLCQPTDDLWRPSDHNLHVWRALKLIQK